MSLYRGVFVDFKNGIASTLQHVDAFFLNIMPSIRAANFYVAFFERCDFFKRKDPNN